MNSDNEIITDITGVAYSGAALISMSGDYRKMSKLGDFMLHSPNWSNFDSLEGHELILNKVRNHYFRIMKILLLRTKLPFKDFLINTKNKDWYLSPKEALKYKFVDRIY